jgi:hypothetical protein
VILLPFFTGTFCDSFTQRPFGNYWAFVVFSGPDFVAYFSDGLKIMDPSFITCDDIGHMLETFEAAFWPPQPVASFAHRSTDVAPI